MSQPASVESTPSASMPQMSLRDWFAGQALTGMIPAPKQPGVPSLNIEGMAKVAYEYADALLKRRELKDD